MPSSNLFSDRELQYVRDQKFLVTKNAISKKLYDLLGQVEHVLHENIKSKSLPEGVLVKSGKISRGEQYRDLPYMVLDYPRAFENENIFAFRTMFWWGNYFSATLHLSGRYLDIANVSLLKHLAEMVASDCYFCVNNDPWQYHYQSNNYMPLNTFSTEKLKEVIEQRPFIKLSQKWPLENYAQLPERVVQHFENSMRWVLA